MADDYPRLAEIDGTLPLALLRAREALMEGFRPILRRHGVTEQQWRVLRTVQQLGEVTASELATRCCLLLPSVTRIVRGLERSGLLRRAVEASDQRRRRIALTAAGQRLIAAAAPEVLQRYAELDRAVGAVRLRSLVEQLNAFTTSIQGRD